MKYFLPLLAMALMTACTAKTEVKEEKPTAWKQSVESLMAGQEKAWNQGDLEAFMKPYLPSDSLLFIGSRGLSYGWHTTLENYKKSYPDQEAMGTLKFENKEYKALGESHALVIGRWNLYRSSDTLSGSYSLVWQYRDGAWKIIADHSS